MEKCKLYIAGVSMVLDTDDAMKLFKVLNEVNPQMLDYKYVNSKDSPTGNSEHLYYLRPMSEKIQLTAIDDAEYAVWKLYTAEREKNNEN